MFVGITNTPRDYAWGSDGAISELLGLAASGAPEGELWLGAHPGSPSRILDPAKTGGATDLAAWIVADPSTALGDASANRLPFLLKVLAARTPLSLQAHPTAAQAAAGFARENAAGIALDAASRNYKDAFPKPELIYILSDTFDALCGFRPVAQIRASVDLLIENADAQQRAVVQLWLDRLVDDDSLRPVFEWLISRGDGVDELVEVVVEIAAANPGQFGAVVVLAEAWPADPSSVLSLLLHRVTLSAGEALYLPAGNIHAYLSGMGVELMAASDNVLRGGATAKHIDVPELLAVLDFTPGPVPYLAAETPEPGLEVYRPDVPDFVLVRIQDAAAYELTGPAIVICTEGDFEITGASSTTNLARGDCLYITPDERALAFAGLGTAFLATTGRLI